MGLDLSHGCVQVVPNTGERVDGVGRIDRMTFGAAIEAMKHGKKVARAGWNGKGMYIWLAPRRVVHSCRYVTDPHLKEINDASGTDSVTFGPSARMRAADGSVVTGWLASQTDMFAEDWCIVE